jgi:predicted  nucleic acid-binding Zn-ribbon protein
MEAAQATWRPLGELIVERGLITQEQLEDALLEQKITRKRLGTILVEKGVVSAQQLTNSLVDQIGVEDLLDEFEQTEADSNGKQRTAPQLGAPLRRFRERIRGVQMPDPSRLATPFVRVGARTAELGRRGRNASARLVTDRSLPRPHFGTAERAPAETSAPPVEPEQFVVETAVELEIVQSSAPEVEAKPTEEPHAWLAVAQGALEQAEAELARLDSAAAARAQELEDVQAELADRESELTSKASAHRQAEEEVGRLHALIDERDVGLTAMEATVEELRELRTAAQAELADLLREFERATRELESAQREVSQRNVRITELESTMKDYEQRGHRISDLEAQSADLAENLSATDETLGIEMHAREQAQREAKRLQEELDDRDARIAKLTRQVESFEAELQVMVAEREQAQRKLRSRERRVTKLESTLAELRADPEPTEAATPDPAPVEPEEQEPETPAPAAEELEVEPEAQEPATEAPAGPEPVAEPTPQTEGFLYFVPRPGEGYELVQHDGIAPMIGRRIELEGQSFDVTRHGRSPLPFDRRVCVYLRAAE